MIYKHLKLTSLLASLFIFFAFSLSAEVSPDVGKTLFKANCAQCHAKNMKTPATGPALGGVQERWESDEEIYAWIRNSAALVSAGNARAVEIFNEWNKSPMLSFPNLTDDDIGSILAYVNGVYEGTYGVVAGPVGVAATEEESDNTYLYWLLLGVLAILGLALARVIGNLDRMNAMKEGREVEQKTLLQTLTSKGVIGFLIFGLVVLGGYTTVKNATNLGRQQGYQPEQPIAFSHETHAGVHKIDCQYCHDGARRSKHSVIPAANTCMNCHRAIKVGSKHGTAEITKIYASIGYNPLDNTYMKNYENMSEDTVKSIYMKWFKQEYITAEELVEIDNEGERLIISQWDNLVSSLTNEQKKTIYGPIEWTRVHNLPDHVYFNHAQHVTVGQVECQTCHGAVEEMEVLEQASPLSMGWCINCHRQTAVKFNENEYYKSYAKYHEELENGTREKVTVAEIGGLECQKCHY